MVCQYKFINCNKCTHSDGDDNEINYIFMRTGNIWEISVSFPQFCQEPKIAPQKKY